MSSKPVAAQVQPNDPAEIPDAPRRGRGQRGPSKTSELTRERILQAAAQVFRHKGYVAATLEEIAQGVEMRAATVLYYFASKEALLEEVLRIGIETPHHEVLRKLELAPPGTGFHDLIRIAIVAHLGALHRHNDFTAAGVINYNLATPGIRKRQRERREAYGDFWRDLLGRAQQAGALAADVDLSLMRLFLIGGLNWSHEWFSPKGKTIEQIGRDICRLLLTGAANPLPSTRKPAAR